MSEKKKKILYHSIAIGLITLFLLILVSSMINIGERLRSISFIVEIIFYVLCFLLIWLLIINPVRYVLLSPSLSIVTTLDKDSVKAHRTYKAVTKNILKVNDSKLTEEEKTKLTTYKNYGELKEALNLTLNNTVKKEIRQIIIRNAKTVMLSTAISQNAKLDMFSTLSVNLKMVKEIVEACGFRPSMKNLSKLTINVLSTSLIAEGMENLTLDDILPNQTIQSINSIPFIKPLISSVTQGLMNALLTIRIGLVCRGYLFSDSKSMTKNQIRLHAFKDSLTLLPIVVGEVLTIFPKKLVKLFTPKAPKEEVQPE